MWLEQSKVRSSGKRELGYSIYCMITEDVAGFSYFKFGISESPVYRMEAVQTGCPVKIVEIMFLPGFSRRAAQELESEIHKRLAEHRSSGEWFKFNIKEEEHKAAFNFALKLAIARLIAHAPHKAMRWIRRTRAEIDAVCAERQGALDGAGVRMRARQIHRLVNGSQY